MKGIDRLLSWFPAGWQARYGAEVRDLLQSQPVTWRDYRDLLVACLDAWARQGPAAAFRFWLIVWELSVMAVAVASVAGIGWVVAAGAHQATVHVGFAAWLQGQAGPSLSVALTDARDMLWLATCWCVLGWRWKQKPLTPGAMTIVSVLVAFSVLLALDPNGPRFVDGMCLGSVLCHPVTRRPGFVAWLTKVSASSSRA